MQRKALFKPLAPIAIAVIFGSCESKVPATRTQAPTESKSPNPSSAPSGPRSVAVGIPAKGLTLEGTLELPATKGPYPAVVLVHGSGPHSRDQVLPGQLAMRFAQPIFSFRDLSRQLAQLGIAVLRYDKRSCFTGNGCKNKYPEPGADIVIEDFAHDAMAALRYLSQQPEIDPSRLAVVGHSQGAGLVPAILQAMPELYAGVAIAAPGPSFAQTLRHQVDKTLSLVPESQHPQVREQMKPLIADIAKIEAVERGEALNTPVLGAPATFIKSQVVAAQKSLQIAQQVDQPILALRGSYDWNIPRTDFEAWREALAGSKHADKHKVLELPGLTHALNRVNQPDPSKIQADDVETQVHPSVARAIAEVF